MSNQVRVRFAPSPTGPLHIGGVRTALYNYLFAKKAGGTFILRIEDTDRTRFVAGAEEYIIQSLEWLNLLPTESVKLGGPYGPYRQSERKALYQKYAQVLLENGSAYYAFDTPEELKEAREKDAMFKYNFAIRRQMKNSLALSDEIVQQYLDEGKPYVLRFKIPEGEIIEFKDEVRGVVRFHSDELDDKVMLKADGMPTYHLANIVDDHLMKITHVIRGEEWLSSTPLHVLLYRAFGWEYTMPSFAHLPLILKPKGKGKLSKRDGQKFGFPVFPMQWSDPKTGEQIMGFDSFGFLPDALLNFLVFLGWNPGSEQEIFSIDELVELFDLTRISKGGARFNIDKAKWFNQQYIMASDNATLAKLIRPSIEAKGHQPTDAFLTTFCGLWKERVHTLNDFWTVGYYFFELPKTYHAKTIRKKWKPEKKAIIQEIAQSIETIDNFDDAAIKQTLSDKINASGLRFGDVLPVLRVAVSGTPKGTDLFAMMALLGKAEVMKRFQIAFAHFDD